MFNQFVVRHSIRAVGRRFIVTAVIGCIAAVFATSPTFAQESDPAPADSPNAGENTNDDAVALAAHFKTSLEQAKLSFLEAKHLAALHDEMLELLNLSIDRPLVPQQRSDIEHGISRFIGRDMSARNSEECYLSFRNLMETLKWQVRVTIGRGPATPEQLTALETQRQWMRGFIARIPDDRFAKRGDVEARMERLLGDPLNVFTQWPLDEGQFLKLQQNFDVKKPKLVFAAYDLFQKLIDLQLPGLFEKWPVKNRGWSRGNDQWALNVNQATSSAVFHATPDSSSVYFDLERMTFKRDPPAVPKALEGWINSADVNGLKVDLYYDVKSDNLVAARDAKLALLPAADWMAADKVPTGDLEKLIEDEGRSVVSVGLFTKPRPGTPDWRERNTRAPFLVVRNKEGLLATIRVSIFNTRDPELQIRMRPLPANVLVEPNE